MAVGCVFSCRHPLWGGDGICITDDGDSDPTVDAACSCGAGFSSRDGAGFPSCVPKLALVSGYTIFGISGLLTTGFLLLHANRYRYLAQQCRSTRRVAVRIRALVSGSGYSLGMGLVGLSLAIRAGETCLADPGVVQAIYCVIVPLALYACSMLAGFWVEALPSQLLPPHSFAAKLREAAETRDLFFVIAWLGVGGSTTVGAMNFFFPPFWLARISDAIAAVGATVAAVFVIYAATQMTRFIDTSSAKAPASSQEFYAKARKSVRSQAAVLSSLAAMHVVAAATRHLTVVGRGTPLFFNIPQMGAAFVALVVFAHFTTFTPCNKGAETTRGQKRPYINVVRVNPFPASTPLPDAQQRQEGEDMLSAGGACAEKNFSRGGEGAHNITSVQRPSEGRSVGYMVP